MPCSATVSLICTHFYVKCCHWGQSRWHQIVAFFNIRLLPFSTSDFYIFHVYFPKTTQSALLKTASVFEVLSKKVVCCPVTSLIVSSRMGPGQKREDLCPGKKFYNSKPTEVTEPEVSKNPKQCFFMPTPSKKAKKMPNYDVHAKHHFFMPNNFKMLTWQPWLRHRLDLSRIPRLTQNRSYLSSKF